MTVSSRRKLTVYLSALTLLVVAFASAVFPRLSASAQDGWSSVDINTPTGGSTSVAGSTVRVQGSGADIWSSADSFRYVYQARSGDLEISAQVTSWNGSGNSWAKGGLMLRSSTAPNAANVLVAVTGGKGITMQWRSADGNSTVMSAGPATYALPVWLKLKKAGALVSAYHSADGITWNQIGAAQSIGLTSTFLAGMAVTSHVEGAFAEAAFSSVSFAGASAPSVPSSTPTLQPTVAATSTVVPSSTPTPQSTPSPVQTSTPPPSQHKEPIAPDWVSRCAANEVPFESQSWWTSDFGHIHAGFCAPQNQTITGKYTFNVRLILHHNPGTITRLQVNFDKDPYNQTVYLDLKCPITDTCAWDRQITADTSAHPYDGWHQIRVRVQVNEPDGKVMATSNYIPVYFKNGKPVSAPFGNVNGSSDYIAGRGWYTNAGYATGIMFDPRAAGEVVRGIYKVKVRSADSDNPLPVTRFIVKLDATHTDPGTVLYDAPRSASTPFELSIDTTKLQNGWHSLLARTEMGNQPGSTCSVCSGQPQIHAGVMKVWFYVQN